MEALTDPKTWLLFVYNFSISLPNGGVSNVSLSVSSSGVVAHSEDEAVPNQ